VLRDGVMLYEYDGEWKVFAVWDSGWGLCRGPRVIGSAFSSFLSRLDKVRRGKRVEGMCCVSEAEVCMMMYEGV